MKNRNFIAMGVVLLGLVAFKGADDNGPVRYSVIHTAGNTVTVFDTTVTDSEAYTVENFLEDHGLNASEAEIFNFDEMQATEIRTLDNNVWFMNSDLPGGGHEATEIRIEKSVNDEGVEEVRKWVNGEEVEWDGEELPEGYEVIIEEEIGPEGENIFLFECDSTSGAQHQIKVMVLDDDGEQKDIEFETLEMNVEVETTIDEEGNEVTHVFVNGEEVDPSALDEMNTEMSGENILIELVIEEEEIQEGEVENAMVYEVEFVGNGMSGLNQTFVFVSSQADSDEPSEKKVEQQNSSIQNMRFMPNPSGGQFNLTFELLEKKRTQIQIHDMSGKLIYNEDLGKFSGPYSGSIDISAQGPGTYILSVNQGNERIAEKLIVR